MTYQNIVDEAQRILADTGADRWPEADLLQFALEGERYAFSLLPAEATPLAWKSTNYNTNPYTTTFAIPNNLFLISSAKLYQTVEGGDSDPIHITYQEQDRALSSSDLMAPSSIFRILTFKNGVMELRPAPDNTVANGLEVLYQAAPAGGTLSSSISLPDAAGDAVAWYVAAMAKASEHDSEGYAQFKAEFLERMEALARRYASPPTARRVTRP